MEEYLPLCELTIMVNLHLKMFFTGRIYTSLWVFCWRVPLLTIMVSPSLEYVFYLKNIHLCTSWLKLCFLHLKKKINSKNIYLCASWQTYFCPYLGIRYSLHLKSFPPEQYTPLCNCFLHFFQWKILTNVGVD